jgi:hypothetical protein
LPFSCILQFAPDSASFVLSFALDVPSPTFPSLPPQLTTSLPHVDPIASSYQKVYNWLFTRCVFVSFYHIEWIDGAHGNVCVPRVSGSNFAFSSSRVLEYVWSCIHPWPLSFFTTLFLLVLFLVKCTWTRLPRYSIACTVLLSIHTILNSPG